MLVNFSLIKKDYFILQFIIYHTRGKSKLFLINKHIFLQQFVDPFVSELSRLSVPFSPWHLLIYHLFNSPQIPLRLPFLAATGK